nr:MAG TPA: Terminase large subunit [Caudoviricetes sp.]
MAKLLETNLKKNLYYEIKDRVIEETNDGIRIVRKKTKTKVFGLDSSKSKRELLIQILKERMESHKDKFVSPVIFEELKRMEIKRNGKVEHADNYHDDQVFSYLMALYVWYEGKDLKQRFNIDKTTIQTDENIDEVVTGLEEKYSDIITEIEYIQKKDDDDDITKQLAELKQGKGVTLKEFLMNERSKENELFNVMLQNRAIKRAYARDNNITPEDVDYIYGNAAKSIPDAVLLGFNTDDDRSIDMMLADDIKNYMEQLKRDAIR